MKQNGRPVIPEMQGQQQEKTAGKLTSGMKGVAIASVISGYILGPLVLFGGIGWWLTSRFENRLFLIVGVAAAFIVSNVLIIRNTSRSLEHIRKL